MNVQWSARQMDAGGAALRSPADVGGLPGPRHCRRWHSRATSCLGRRNWSRSALFGKPCPCSVTAWQKLGGLRTARGLGSSGLMISREGGWWLTGTASHRATSMMNSHYRLWRCLAGCPEPSAVFCDGSGGSAVPDRTPAAGRVTAAAA